MDIDLGDISGVGKQFQEHLPVKNNEVTKESGKPVKTTHEVERDRPLELSKSNSNQLRIRERTPRTRLRDLSRGMRNQPRNVRSKEARYDVKIQKPRESKSSSAPQKMAEVIKNVQRKYMLPKSKDLVNRLKPVTQQSVQQITRQALADSDLVNPKKFLDTLSKMVPLAVATINEGKGQSSSTLPTDLSTMLMQMMNDLAPHINKLLSLEKLPDDLKGLLQQLSQQLATIKKGELSLTDQLQSMKHSQVVNAEALAKQLEQMIQQGKNLKVAENQALIQQLVAAKAIHESYLGREMIPAELINQALASLQAGILHSQNRNVLQTMEQLMAQLQSGTMANLNARQFLVTNLAMFRMMSGAISLSGKEQAKFIRDLMANQLLFSTGQINKGMLGPNTQELAKKIAEMVMLLAGKISMSMQQPLLKGSSSESLFRLFSSILFGGALFGRMIADRGDGKPWGLDEAYAGQLQLQSAKELKIYDLVPFSLFASFPPVKEGKEQTEEQKAALKLLMKLIRLLMNLAFMITSIYTGGQKIGKGGIDYMLEKNGPFLLDTIKQLIITLKKVGKSFDIAIRAPLSFLRRSKQALIEKDHPVFWSCIFAFFTDENDLNAFVEEIEELDPVYESIHNLIGQ